jgi:hypothetical protein
MSSGVVLRLSFEGMSDADHDAYMALASQFALWMGLNWSALKLQNIDPEQTTYFRALRNAVVLAGGTCVSVA